MFGKCLLFGFTIFNLCPFFLDWFLLLHLSFSLLVFLNFSVFLAKLLLLSLL